MPKPVRELLRLVHVEQIDVKNIKQEDWEVAEYLFTGTGTVQDPEESCSQPHQESSLIPQHPGTTGLKAKQTTLSPVSLRTTAAAIASSSAAG